MTDDKNFQIFLGKTLTFLVKRSHSVHGLKLRVQRCTGLPPHLFELQLHGRYVDSWRTLGACGVLPGDTLRVTGRLRGGVGTEGTRAELRMKHRVDAQGCPSDPQRWQLSPRTLYGYYQVQHLARAV